MQPLRYAFRFIEASFSKLLSDSRQQKNWLIFFVGGASLCALSLLPLALIIRFMGLSPLGLGLIGLIAGCHFLGLVLWGKLRALVTCQNFTLAFQDAEEQTESALPDRVPQRHWKDVVLWIFAKPWLHMASWRARFFQGQVKPQSQWLDAYHLVTPLIALEDLNFSQAIQRAKGIQEERLLRFRSDLVAVRPVGAVLQWLLIISGAIVGLLVAFNIAYANTTGFRRRLLGMGVGMIILGAATLLGMAFKNFTEACYQSALYQWVCNVAAARQAGDKGLALAPESLRRVFGRKDLL